MTCVTCMSVMTCVTALSPRYFINMLTRLSDRIPPLCHHSKVHYQLNAVVLWPIASRLVQHMYQSSPNECQCSRPSFLCHWRLHSAVFTFKRIYVKTYSENSHNCSSSDNTFGNIIEKKHSKKLLAYYDVLNIGFAFEKRDYWRRPLDFLAEKSQMWN